MLGSTNSRHERSGYNSNAGPLRPLESSPFLMPWPEAGLQGLFKLAPWPLGILPPLAVPHKLRHPSMW
ncbi:hypothetical protein LIER_43499 [Lithospermum erythrorhizon]|uniref:Uncharacterized protein n=1 Tax=Lithospermum erythrorhizon TaxID=34254 RepID=A0AAV3Q8Y6_LITER